MTTRLSIAVLALAVTAAPAFGQMRSSERVRDVILEGRRAETRTSGRVSDVIFGRSGSTREGTRDDSRASARVPKGHLPPRGMCRVWVDGVPPGHQPPVTSCADAERERYQYGANARVIYGSDQAFPGKGKGKYKTQDRSRTDIFGRRVEDTDDDDERLERRRAIERVSGAAQASKGKGKGNGKGKKG